MRFTVSLCMIVKNEEEVIGKCLESIHKQINEIIIVDTGSSDRTIPIAESYGATIHSYKWNDDFASARNYSLQQAKSDYILILDADEYFEGEYDLQKELATAKDFYIFPIHNLLDNERYFIHSAIRLFKNSPELRYKNRLHEHLDLEGKEKQMQWSKVSVSIQHTGYQSNTIIEKDKNNRNLNLMMQETKEHPNSYNFYNLGKAYMAIEQYEESAEYFAKAITDSDNQTHQADLLKKWGESLLQLNRSNEALKILYDAVQKYPAHTDLLYVLAEAYYDEKYLKDAASTWIKCTELGNKGDFISEGVSDYLAYAQLAELYKQEDNLAEAYKYILKAITSKRSHMPALKKYFEIAYIYAFAEDDIKKDLDISYKITRVEELQNLLDVLYTMRHYLFSGYLKSYNISPEKNVLAISYQYSKQYDLAKNSWYEVEHIPEENTIDILTLAFLLKDEKLVKSLQNVGEIGPSDIRILLQLLHNESIQMEELSSSLETLIFQLVNNLIYMKEFEAFQTVLQLLMGKDFEVKYQIGSMLNGHGYYEAAIDILVQAYHLDSENIQMIGLLGDICLRAGYFDDAEYFYTNLIERSPVYASYERYYRLYERKKDESRMQEIKQFIAAHYPMATWSQE
ncbi:TPR domain-containing glycosyltransferase [Paenibacillus bovis]|uniref:Glycosyltransferase 2-like domain-containing protein n=1 Tax=Paenibacillus bovis TaxID=1616788 RepID=A0A172ZLR1_9BACL|nr:TPR domain-containing glycosyltransferase [Paenibacillus bovis]ANF98483.1 hypothetical protein AR543_22480 [Paenibacillus bovis]